MKIVQIAGLEKYYRSGDYEVHALDGVPLDVEDGEFLAVVGTLGSGKTTFLKSFNSIILYQCLTYMRTSYCHCVWMVQIWMKNLFQEEDWLKWKDSPADKEKFNVMVTGALTRRRELFIQTIKIINL